MFEKPDWRRILEQLKREEVVAACKGLPDFAFPKGLELGAGSGYQSGLLLPYVKHLVASDLNENRWQGAVHAGLSFQVLDAEEVGAAFPKKNFDLIFSSNLLEHLPSIEQTLLGTKQVLKDDGIAIHILPSRFWKLCHFFLFFVDRAYLAWRKLKQGSVAKKKFETTMGNNPKLSVATRSRFAQIFWPAPHGVKPTNLSELRAFGQEQWKKRFSKAGFRVVSVKPGPVTSPYGFGWNRMRQLCRALGFTSEHIFVLCKEGCKSPLERYF